MRRADFGRSRMKSAKKTKRSIPDLPIHPAANLFPMLEDEDLAKLAEDIATRGQQVPIALFDGKILDGRNRFMACQTRGIKPWTTDVTTDDPYAFVMSANMHRRHLKPGQRAMIASKLAKLRDGERKTASPRAEAAVTQQEAADLLDVGKRSVERAREVEEHGVPDLVTAVDKDEIGVKPAAEFAKAVGQIDQQRLIEEHGSAAAAVKAYGASVKAKADRAERRPPAKQSKNAIKAAADRAERRENMVARLKQETQEKRTDYITAAKSSCSTAAEWAEEADTVADQLSKAEASSVAGRG
jgi:hypothetical protein